MSLSKKHYQAVAATIRGVIKENSDVPTLASRLAVYFKIDNPAFDSDRFLSAAIPPVLQKKPRKTKGGN